MCPDTDIRVNEIAKRMCVLGEIEWIQWHINIWRWKRERPSEEAAAVEKERNSSSFSVSTGEECNYCSELPSPLWASVLWDSQTHTKQLIRKHFRNAGVQKQWQLKHLPLFLARCVNMSTKPFRPWTSLLKRPLQMVTRIGCVGMLVPSVGFWWPQQVSSQFFSSHKFLHLILEDSKEEKENDKVIYTTFKNKVSLLASIVHWKTFFHCTKGSV